MDAIDERLLDLLLDGDYSRNLKQLTHLTQRQLLIHLRELVNSGYNLGRKYYSDGSVGHYLEKQILASEIPFSVITAPDEKKIKIMLISDLHIGNAKENLKYLDLIYEYCVANGIHIIFNGGDLIDGKLMGNGKKKIWNYKKQIKRVIHEHPYDRGIINFIGLGNHDLDSFHSCGIDITPLLQYSREDLVPIGYGYGVVNIKNEQFPIRHKIKKLQRVKQSSAIITNGHSHKNRITCRQITPDSAFKINVFVASLSDIPMGNPTIHPGAIEMEITFNDHGYIRNSDFTILDVGDHIAIAGEKSIALNRDYINTKTDISYEEDYRPKVFKKEL